MKPGGRYTLNIYPVIDGRPRETYDAMRSQEQMEQPTTTGLRNGIFGGLILCLLIAFGVAQLLEIGTKGDLIGLAIGGVAGSYYAWRTTHPDPRTLPGHCKKCGYNLTGNESGRCPECGADASSA